MPITRSKTSPKGTTSRSTRSGVSPRSTQPAKGMQQPFSPGSKRSVSRQKTSPERFSILDGISNERRMDILGMVLAIVGLLTLLSLFSVNNSGFTGEWIRLLNCLLYTSDAADEEDSVDLGGR